MVLLIAKIALVHRPFGNKNINKSSWNCWMLNGPLWHTYKQSQWTMINIHFIHQSLIYLLLLLRLAFISLSERRCQNDWNRDDIRSVDFVSLNDLKISFLFSFAKFNLFDWSFELHRLINSEIFNRSNTHGTDSFK